MKKVSLICVYNNSDKFQEMAASSKNQKDVEIEHISIDNTSGVFTSAASALNYGVKQATSNYLVFLHQDIIFLEPDALIQIVNYLDQAPNTLMGAAGVQRKKKLHDDMKIISSMYEGLYKHAYNSSRQITEVFVLDECFFACKKDLFNCIQFDEKTCDGWHLYTADLCLNAYLHNIDVIVLPLPQIWHKSHGFADKTYFKTQNRLAKKYKKYFKIINTTNSFVYTSFVKRTFQNAYRKVKYKNSI